MYKYIATILLIVLVGCGETATPTATSEPAPSIQAILAGSVFTTGLSRLPIGLVVDGSPVNEPGANVSLDFYYLDDPATRNEVVGSTTATYYGQGLPAGVYVAYPEFPKAGTWAIDVKATLPGMDEPAVSRLRLNVLPQDPLPALGAQAIAVDTPTASSAEELEKITSAAEQNPALYQISLAEALQNDKPTAVLFATPGFCRTATCGPSVQVLGQLAETYAEDMNFIHVEVYEYPFSESFQATPPNLAPAMEAWGLLSEPWLFLIDRRGIIRARYEGGITQEEIAPIIQTLVDEETN